MDGQLLEERPMVSDVLFFFCFLKVLASLPKMQKVSRKPKNPQKKKSDIMDGQLLEEWPMVSDVLLFFSGFLEVLAIFRFSQGFGHLPKSAKGKEQLSLSYCSRKQVQYQFCVLAAQFLFWY